MPISDYITKHNDTLINLGIVKELDYKELSVQGIDEVFSENLKLCKETKNHLFFKHYLVERIKLKYT